eukprot:GHVH01005745.1.p1 GENE.GHVH01005745.1~~GHVH01005745.1.p1  ORF type:complete len:389 (+),score=61.71 GHVH01005745.1:139-1305(+)
MDSCIIDLGGDTVRAGLTSQSSPRETPSTKVRSIGASPKSLMPTMLTSQGFNDPFYFGSESARMFSKMVDRFDLAGAQGFPDWDVVEPFLHHLFSKELMIEPNQHEVMFSFSPWVIDRDGAKLMTIMFETFNVPGMVMEMDSLLSLYSHGLTSGVVLDSGHRVTRCVPVYEGYAIPAAVVKHEFGGHDITDHLIKRLGELDTRNSINLDSAIGYEWARRSKHELATCASHFDLIMANNENEDPVSVTLPDGTQIDIDPSIRVELGECLFDPSILGKSVPGLQEVVFNSIKSTDIDMRRECYRSTVLAGGNCCVEGFRRRFDLSLIELVPSAIEVKTFTPKREKVVDSVWHGGSILASLSSFEDMWILQEEYDELGPTIISRKVNYHIS